MVQESRENTFINIKEILGYFTEMVRNSLKADLEEESKLPKELQDTTDRVTKKAEALHKKAGEAEQGRKGRESSIRKVGKSQKFQQPEEIQEQSITYGDNGIEL